MIIDQVLTLLGDCKAQDVVAIDVSELTSMTNSMVICTGTSTRHVKSIASELSRHFKAQFSQKPHIEGEAYAQWVLVDLEDVIVHIMLAEMRDYYQLEKLWHA